MKIIKRIPLEPYAYEELHFDSIEEYQEQYPKYVETFKRVRTYVNTPPELREEPIILTQGEEEKLP